MTEDEWLTSVRWFTETDRAVEHVLKPGMVVVRLQNSKKGLRWIKALDKMQRICGHTRVGIFADFENEAQRNAVALHQRLSDNSTHCRDVLIEKV